MKKVITLAVLMIILGLTVNYREPILKFIDGYLHPNNITVLDSVNDYYRNYDFNFVKQTNNFTPSNINDLINIYYTFINAGKDQFTFYCPREYEECLDDVKKLANNQDTLSDLNNFVHPFNSFNNIETKYDSMGRVTITVSRNYTEEEIQKINTEVNLLSITLIKDNLSTLDNIKTIHDYIINNTKYDSLRSDQNILTYKSNTAYGPLLQGYGICGGYTEAMQLFLERLNVKNYRVSSDNHIWNAVYLDGKWYNLDLTWDDPVITNLDADVLEHNFFMIDTSTLLEIETSEHEFDQQVYSELAV